MLSLRSLGRGRKGNSARGGLAAAALRCRLCRWAVGRGRRRLPHQTRLRCRPSAHSSAWVGRRPYTREIPGTKRVRPKPQTVFVSYHDCHLIRRGQSTLLTPRPRHMLRANESEVKCRGVYKVRFWIHRHSAQRHSAPLRNVPAGTSGAVNLTLAAAKKSGLGPGRGRFQFLTVQPNAASLGRVRGSALQYRFIDS